MLAAIPIHELLTHLLLYSISNTIYESSRLLRLILVESEDGYLPVFCFCAMNRLLDNIPSSFPPSCRKLIAEEYNQFLELWPPRSLPSSCESIAKKYNTSSFYVLQPPSPPSSCRELVLTTINISPYVDLPASAFVPILPSCCRIADKKTTSSSYCDSQHPALLLWSVVDNLNYQPQP